MIQETGSKPPHWREISSTRILYSTELLLLSLLLFLFFVPFLSGKLGGAFFFLFFAHAQGGQSFLRGFLGQVYCYYVLFIIGAFLLFFINVKCCGLAGLLFVAGLITSFVRMFLLYPSKFTTSWEVLLLRFIHIRKIERAVYAFSFFLFLWDISIITRIVCQ